MVKVKMGIILPYLCVCADKIHTVQFAHIQSWMAVSVGECMFLLRVRGWVGISCCQMSARLVVSE